MAYSKEAAQRIRDELARAQVQDVREIKMYGGLAFMVRDKMCICAGGDDLIMVRVGKERYAEALTREGALPSLMKGRPVMGYVDVNAQGQQHLTEWVQLALAFNRELTGQGPA